MFTIYSKHSGGRFAMRKVYYTTLSPPNTNPDWLVTFLLQSVCLFDGV
jgi:hypothetical protein